ncbi:MAG TPA: VOC family protein, partial [Gemmatimonadaceae bacterium]|nr:VOC family protein [Gemmatimonadaceae bacterium]
MATSAQAPVRNANAVQGRFTWHDLMTTDPDAAKAFYTAVAGWGTQDWPGTTPPYTMFLAGDAMVGGVMQLPDEAIQQGAMSHWLTYIETQDVDETFALATKLGASTYVPPTDIPTVGRFAVLADPQGAMFALFTPLPSASPPARDPNRPGEFSWHELMTTQQNDAFAFYEELFGWKKTSAMDMGEQGVYQMFGLTSDVPIGGVYTIGEGMGAPPNWLPYIHVDSADAATERVKQLGGS